MNHDINDVRPTSISHMVGQPGIVERVKVALDAAHMDGTPFPHTLAVGPAGTGKTQLAHLIAQEMQTDFFETLGESLSNAAQLNQFLLAGTQNDRSVLHVDEGQSIPKSQQTRLLIALSANKLVYEGNNGPQSIPLGRFTLIISSTEQWSLLPPLISRMRIFAFSFYSATELATLLQRRVMGLGWEVESGVLEEIAKRGLGIPRQSLSLLQSSRMVARSEGHTIIRRADMERAFALEGIDDVGLGPVERAYLQRLEKSGASRLNVISSSLGLPSRTIQTNIESTLIRLDLISKTNSGARELTKAGRDHLARNRPISASII
jgi:Holliday junction DNA helicase RuvB